FSSGERHRRRRAFVESELARLEPGALRCAVTAGTDGEVRVRVVHALAEALEMPEPSEIA
ncbi:isocitrate lyase/phosphoenolpyruvate mutase family protein, partial [Streptomyces sp. T-3]|nr:isocitrate lyase/phosphoenolpyruvate mutase family protein [Streptomyces sp. T-3]